MKAFAFFLTVIIAVSGESALSADTPEAAYARRFDPGVMGTPATAEIVKATDAAVSKPMAKGPFQANWESLEKIPDDQQKTLLGIGEWLAVNGEAIYEARPWNKFGEGDVRFTTKGKTLYAIALKWPDSDLVIRALGNEKIKKIELLGQKEPLKFSQEEQGLRIKIPLEPSNDSACVFKMDR